MNVMVRRNVVLRNHITIVLVSQNQRLCPHHHRKRGTFWGALLEGCGCEKSTKKLLACVIGSPSIAVISLAFVCLKKLSCEGVQILSSNPINVQDPTPIQSNRDLGFLIHMLHSKLFW